MSRKIIKKIPKSSDENIERRAHNIRESYERAALIPEPIEAFAPAFLLSHRNNTNTSIAKQILRSNKATQAE